MCSRIRALHENGVYNYWLDETLMANNKALKKGLVEPIKGNNGYDKYEDDIGQSQVEPLGIRNFYSLICLVLNGMLISFFVLAVERRLFQELIRNLKIVLKKWLEI